MSETPKEDDRVTRLAESLGLNEDTTRQFRETVETVVTERLAEADKENEAALQESVDEVSERVASGVDDSVEAVTERISQVVSEAVDEFVETHSRVFADYKRDSELREAYGKVQQIFQDYGVISESTDDEAGSLRAQLDETQKENRDLRRRIRESEEAEVARRREAVFAESTEGLSRRQKEKARKVFDRMDRGLDEEGLREAMKDVVDRRGRRDRDEEGDQKTNGLRMERTLDESVGEEQDPPLDEGAKDAPKNTTAEGSRYADFIKKRTR